MVDVDELVLKVGIETDTEQLKRIRDEIKKLQEMGKSNSIKLGIETQSTSGLSDWRHSSEQSTNFSDEILAIMSLSEKHLMEMLNIVKTDHQKKERTTDEEERRHNMQGPIPFVQDVLHGNIGNVAGAGIGAGISKLTGNNAVNGAQVGSAIGGILQTVFDLVKSGAGTVKNLLDERLSQDIHFRALSYQTGMSVDNLYKFQQQAKLAGLSLEQFVESNQRLADELIGGISDQKAQLLMALNINPRTALLEAGGDIGKLNQRIFESILKATQGQPAYLRSSFLSQAGYPAEEAAARRFVYRKDTEETAQGIYNTATKGGQTPLVTGEKLQQQLLNVLGSELTVAAAVREALSRTSVAEKIVTASMAVETKLVQIIADVVEGPGTQPVSKAEIRNKIDVINKTVDENQRQRAIIQERLHHRHPASPSASSKAGAPQ